jgi:hypothetical protein
MSQSVRIPTENNIRDKLHFSCTLLYSRIMSQPFAMLMVLRHIKPAEGRSRKNILGGGGLGVAAHLLHRESAIVILFFLFF